MRGLEFKTLNDLTLYVEGRVGFDGDLQTAMVIAEELWYADGVRFSSDVYDVDLRKLGQALGCYPD